MNIGDVLGKPFKYIWRNSILWGLGMVTQIVPTILTFLVYYFVIVNMGTIQSVLQNIQLYSVRPDLISKLFGNLTPEQILAPFLTVLTVFVLTNLVSAVITEFVRCCIIQGIRMADATQERVRFKEVLQNGWRPFGVLILQDLFWGFVFMILWLGMGLMITGLGTGIANNTNSGAGIVILLCCLGCIALPVALFLSILFPQIKVSLIHDNLGVFSSMGKGWATVKKAFGWMLLVGLVLGAGSTILGWLRGVLQSIPINLSTSVGISNPSQEWQTTQLILLVIFSLVGFLLNSYVFAYVISAWTMAYRSVHYSPASPPAISELNPQSVSRDPIPPPLIPT